MNVNQLIQRARVRLQQGIEDMDVHLPQQAAVGSDIGLINGKGPMGKVTASGAQGCIATFDCEAVLDALTPPVSAVSER